MKLRFHKDQKRHTCELVPNCRVEIIRTVIASDLLVKLYIQIANFRLSRSQELLGNKFLEFAWRNLGPTIKGGWSGDSRVVLVTHGDNSVPASGSRLSAASRSRRNRPALVTL